MLHLQQSIWADRAYILLQTESITSAYDENSLSHTHPSSETSLSFFLDFILTKRAEHSIICVRLHPYCLAHSYRSNQEPKATRLLTLKPKVNMAKKKINGKVEAVMCKQHQVSCSAKAMNT